jgi:Flp pilus assembly pilin Flp
MMKNLLFIAMLIFGISAQAQWTQIGQNIDGEMAGDEFGRTISLSSDGTIVAVGALLNDGNGTDSGHVRVYENIGGTWTQVGQDIDGEAAGDSSGSAISISSDGNTVAVGAFLNDGNGIDSGHVRVYEYIGGTWTQIGQDIDGEAAGDVSGCCTSVSLNSDGSIVAIGARDNDGNGNSSGHVRVYENIGGTWTQVGQDIDGEEEGDDFGVSVSLSSNGSIMAVGSIYNDGNGVDSGHVRVYENIGGTWTQVGQDIDGEAAGDHAGGAVSISSDGSIVAIGSPLNDGNGTDAGHVRVYEYLGGIWTQIGQDIDGEAAIDHFGRSISLNSDGSIVAIGANLNDGNGNNAGHVRIFENNAGTWMQVGQVIEGEAAEDRSGRISLSSDGSILAIGANLNDGNGPDSGHVRVFEYEVLGISEFSENGISIYPNPVNDILNIKAEETINAVSIVNILGQELHRTNVDALNTTIDLSGYGTGTYFVKVNFGDGMITRRIVKE